MNVVFTGPACDGNGFSIVRSELSYACIKKGNITVQNRVMHDTNVLVASRSDTVKARTASLRGVAVFTYPEFISRFLAGVEINTGGKANKYVDSVDAGLLVSAFTSWQSLEVLDTL